MNQSPEISRCPEVPSIQTLHFGERLYRIEKPEPSWSQPSPDETVRCNVCGQTLSFSFTLQDGQSKTGLTAFHLTPTGVRCDCFLADQDSMTLSRHKKLLRAPIPIVPV
jgi:hypothetical protein